MTKKERQKTPAKDSTVLIGIGLTVVALTPAVWAILLQIYQGVREGGSCDLGCAIGGGYGVYIGTMAVGLVGLIFFVGGVVTYVRKK